MSKEWRPSTKHIRVYRQPKSSKCTNCGILENLLTINNIEFDSINLVTPETMTEMAMRHIFPMRAPVLQINSDVYDRELWLADGRTLDIQKIKKLIDDSRMYWKNV